jgi:ABC-2 type transport system permease protein
MRWRPIAGIALRQFYLLRGSPVRLVPTLTWGAIDIVLWGFITRYLNTVSGSGIDFVPALLGAVLLWDISTRVMTGVSTAFLEDVWSRNFLNLFASPLSVTEYVSGLVITSVVTGGLGLIVMVALAAGIFGLHLVAVGPALAGFLLILFVFGVTLGILASAMVLRFGPASEWLIWPLPALLSPFAGVFYPLSTLPSWMQTIAHAIPPSYVFEGMRQILAGGSTPILLLIEGLALAAAELLLAMWGYTRVYRHAVRTGLLARYSAESSS